MPVTRNARMTAVDLIGARVQQAFHVNGCTVLMMALGDKLYQVEVWSDPEGNDSGHLDIQVIVGARPGTVIDVVA